MTKTTFLCLSLAVCFSIGCASTGGNQCKAPAKSERVLRHVVMFKFNSDTTPAQVKEIENAFRALPTQIPEIAGYEWGTDVSPEHLSQGFTHCFFLTFHSAADRDAYLPHPAHKAFGAQLKGKLEKVLVVDYWTQK